MIIVTQVLAVDDRSPTEVIVRVNGFQRRVVAGGWSFGWVVDSPEYATSELLNNVPLIFSMEEFHRLAQFGTVEQRYQHATRCWLLRLVQSPTIVQCDVLLLTAFLS